MAGSIASPRQNNFPGFQRRLVELAGLGILICLAAGCASSNASRQIKSFSEATTLTADNAAQAFELVENARFEEEVSVLVLHFDQKTGFNPADIQPFISPNALRVRLRVLDGLKVYAANLSVLVGNAALTNLDAETTKLGQELGVLDADLVKESFFQAEPVSGQQLQIFTTAINALGHWLIAHKQREEARKAIESMQRPVAGICALLQEDFRILSRQLAKDYNDTLRNENQYILNNLAQFDQTPGDKRAEIQEMAALTVEMRKNTAILTAMESSAAKLAKTHEALAEVFSTNTTNISSLISELSSESRRISKYYNSLRANKP